MNRWMKVLYAGLLFFGFSVIGVASEGSDIKIKIEKAYDAYQKAFEHYTSLALSAQKGDREQALEAYRNRYAEYKQLMQTQDKVPSDNKPAVQEPLDVTGVDGIEEIDPSDVENNIAYIEALRERTEAEASKEIQKPSADTCKTKAFTDLQLSAVQAFENGNHKEALELLEKAYHLCPTDEMTKNMIRDLKLDI